MKELKFRLELNDKPNKEGLKEIFLIITDETKKKVKTNVFVKNDHFGTFKDVLTAKGIVINKRVLNYDKEKWVSDKDKNAAYKNSLLKLKIKEYKDHYDKIKETENYIDKDTVIKAVNNKFVLIDVVSVFDRYIKLREEEDDYLNKRSFSNAKNKLVGFLEKENRSKVDFRQIDKTYLERFERHLYKTINNGNAQDSSVHSIMKCLCRIFNWAREEQIIKRDIYPFGKGGYSLPTIKPKYKERLTQSELVEFQNVYAKVGTVDFNTQNAFMLAVRLAGVRIEDVLTLKVQNVHSGRITYNMKKGCTNGKLKTVKIDNKIQRILDWYITNSSKQNDYIFPFLIAEEIDVMTRTDYKKEIGKKTALINKSLKSLTDKTDINKKITTHTARHSFSSIALKTTKDVKIVQELLNHTDLKTTIRYLDELNVEGQDEVMASIAI
ncbi:MAG: site-specific integrase [Bacteroidia bacterium]